MQSRSIALLFALPLFFCSPQTAPIAPQPNASVAVLPPASIATAQAAPVDPLLVQRADAAQRAFGTAVSQYQTGQTTLEDVGAWSERTANAQREALAGKPLADAGRERAAQWKKIEAFVQTRVQSGTATPNDSTKATYFRLHAEIEAARLP
jgi:hypothetical protein